MIERYNMKFFNFIHLNNCFYDFSYKKKEKPKRIILTPEEKLDILLFDKKIAGAAFDILRIMRTAQKLKIPEVMEILSKKDEKSKKWVDPIKSLYSIIPEKDKKRYNPFNFIKLICCMAKEQEDKIE
ncbi:MAG: hypothetical protein LBT66_04670 [Methanobrevibacter sp.]|jgi:hypothetical protein|nr:hypothetical protein [Candidatus Methanovirga meridionalis]